MSKPEYTLDWINGFCPVQAEGTYQGKRFYFRARGNRWALYIGNTNPLGETEWSYSESYGDEPFAAGWMENEEALGFIEQALRLYAQAI